MAEATRSDIPPVGEVRAPGMDHAHHPFRTLPEAPRFAWPNKARIALTVTVMLDHWELVPPADGHPDPRIVSPLGKFFPDWLTWSHRLYGARVGIFRLLRVLDEFGLRPSVALGAEAARRYPELVDECLRRGACFLAHGTFASRRITSRMSHAEERAFIAESRAAIHAATGSDPRGWFGQDYNESADTPSFLAEAGFDYTMDWANDDRPFLLGPYAGKSLVALPPQPEWSDLESMWLRRVPAQTWSGNVVEAFRFLHGEGGATFNLTLHPFVAGQAHRVRYLHSALSQVLGMGGIWCATTDEVAGAARVQL